MAWNSSIPAVGNAIANDVPDIEENFAVLAILKDVTASSEEINTACDGITATAVEINAACDLTANGFFTTGNVNKILMYLDTAPTGWSIDTALDDKLVFVTKGSGESGQTGGEAHSTGSWTLSGLTANAHTHTYDTVIAHTHTVALHPVDSASGGSDGIRYGGTSLTSTCNTSSAGSAEGTTANASTAGITSAGTWRPAAYNCIMCSLD